MAYVRALGASPVQSSAAIVKGAASTPATRTSTSRGRSVASRDQQGWRLDTSERSAQIDAVVALAMAVDRAQAPKPEPSRLLGWL